MKAFFRELKRRRVIGTVVAYAIAAAGVMQVADVVAPRMNLPDWTVSVVIFVALIGLPIVAVFAWLYDVVPEKPSDPADEVVAQQLPSRPVPNAASRRAVAVLPFVNLSADPDNEYFVDGITEDVISHLSKIGELSVISRRSVMEFKNREQPLREIGSALGAGTLLEGSVRRVADRVRVVAKLLDADSNHNLWAETYDRQIIDVFAIQTDIALQIAAALQATLSSDEKTRIRKQPTGNLQAYQLYLQGRHELVRYTTQSMLDSIEYFRRAIALDEKYAGAYASIAYALAELGETGDMASEAAYPQASEAAMKALELDPELGDAHMVLAALRVFSFDWTGAENGFKRALELSPSNADAWDFYGRLCAALERHDESVAMQKRAQMLDPLAHRSDLANSFLRAGRYAEALAAAKQAVHDDPDYDRGRATLGWAYLKNGRHAEGIAELEQAVSLSPDTTSWFAQLGQALAVTGQVEKARDIFNQLEERSKHRYVSPYHVAYVLTGLGEYDKAIDYLERAYLERAGAIYGVKGSFLFAELHAQPRFVALLKRMNLA